MTRNKFNAKKTVLDGHHFDSMGEARRYVELDLMQRAGEISELQVHPKFKLLDRFKRGKRTIPAIMFTPDFQYVENGVTVVEDFKGMQRVSADFSIRRRWFMSQHPDVMFRVTRKGKKTDEWQPAKKATTDA